MTLCKLFFSALLLSSATSFGAQAAISPNQTKVVYFTLQKQDYFETKVKPLFQSKSESCKNCEIVNLTPYTKEGEVDMPALVKSIQEMPESASFALIDFNLKTNEENKALVEALNKKTAAGFVVIASAGAPQKTTDPSSPLSRTVLGQVQGALIIGELSERDRLMPSGFYGPEMLTAVRPPKDMIGQGFGPLLFASSLAGKWNKRSSTEWVDYFKTKKQKSRKIWLDLDDLF
jgi:hypothetical protein